MPATEPLGPMVRIRDLRLAHNLTLKQLADRIGEQGVPISEGGLSNIETGAKPASARLLTAWAKALGADPLQTWQGPLRKPIEPGVPMAVGQ